MRFKAHWRRSCNLFVTEARRLSLTYLKIRKATCKSHDPFCRSYGTLVLDKLGESGGESEPAIGIDYPRADNRQYELSTRDEMLARATQRFLFSL